MGFLSSLGGGAAAGAGGLIGATLVDQLFGKKGSSTVTQVPLETEEQRKARQRLLGFSETGQTGTYDANARYAPGGLETDAGGRLAKLLQSGMPELFGAGSDALKGFLTTDQYDPFSPTGEYSSFKTQALREADESRARLKREGAISGSIFSNDFSRSLGDLEAQTTNTLQSKLAQLYDTYTQRKLSAIPLAFQAGQAGEGIDLGRISAGYAAGNTDYQRFLNEQQAKAGQVDALKSVAGTNTPFGVPSVTVPQESPWQNVLKLLAQYGGQAFGQYAAGGFGGGGGGGMSSITAPSYLPSTGNRLSLY